MNSPYIPGSHNKDCGGNQVSHFKLENEKKFTFAETPYVYFFQNLGGDHSLVHVKDLESLTVFIYQLSSAPLQFSGIDAQLEHGDALQIEGNLSDLELTSGEGIVLIAGVHEGQISEASIKHTKNTDLKRVSKHWGHELWINGEHPDYALKEIFIKAGTKTSLQYHNLKRETNVLFEGQALLHYKNNPDAANDTVLPGDISTQELSPISGIDVYPQILHRLESVTDALLYEVSTPHLDDVIRVSDDQHRGHGRIEKEHT